MGGVRRACRELRKSKRRWHVQALHVRTESESFAQERSLKGTVHAHEKK